MAIASGISYEVLLKNFNNGVARKICDICYECNELVPTYFLCHMCAFRMCTDCNELLIKNNTNIDGVHCPQCRTIMIGYRTQKRA
jgi:phage FluMu protein Com